MNTNLKILDKQALKKIKGGDGSAEGQLGGACGPGGWYNCKVCHAHSTDGSNIDRSFRNDNYELADAWASAWSAFGYRVECHIEYFT